MKQLIEKTALLIGIACSGLVACQKDPVAPECSATTTGIAGTYKLTAMQYKASASSATIDYLAFMDACEKDDIILLKNDGTYIYTDAGIACTPNGTNNGTWSVAGSTITSDGILNGTIQSYDCKTLVCYIENVNVPGDRFTQTLVKQ